MENELKIDSSKYSVMVDDRGVVTDVLRYGESCSDLRFLNIIQDMTAEILSLREKNEDMRKIVNDANILTAFYNGEWCDTQDICRLLNITFEEGLRKFEFSRTAEWNKAPLNGQKITTQFRIKWGEANDQNQ